MAITDCAGTAVWAQTEQHPCFQAVLFAALRSSSARWRHVVGRPPPVWGVTRTGGGAPDPTAREPVLSNEARLGLGRAAWVPSAALGQRAGLMPASPTHRSSHRHAGPRRACLGPAQDCRAARNPAGSKARRRTFLSILVLFEWVFKAEKFEDRTESSQIAGFSPLVRQEGARERRRLACPRSG